MILTDINLLLYAHNEDDPRYAQASTWFEQLLNGNKRACFCWETINGFIRVSTNPNATLKPFSVRAAFSIVDEWLLRPNAVMLTPAKDHLDILRSISVAANAKGPLYSDAILAAYAISNDATVASTDRDFRLFDGLKLINPISST